MWNTNFTATVGEASVGERNFSRTTAAVALSPRRQKCYFPFKYLITYTYSPVVIVREQSVGVDLHYVMGVKTNLHMITKKPGRQNCEHLIQLKQNGALHKFERAGCRKILAFLDYINFN